MRGRHEPNRYKIIGDVCYLELLDRKYKTVGFATIDAEDYDKIKDMCFCLHYKSKNYYQIFSRKYGKLHRVILGIPPENMVIDHANRNTFDNRKINLRFVTYSQNCWNRSTNYAGTSKFKGVCLDKKRNKWRAQIKLHGKGMFIGRYNDEEDAARAYDEKATELFGEFAVLNNI